MDRINLKMVVQERGYHLDRLLLPDIVLYRHKLERERKIEEEDRVDVYQIDDNGDGGR